MSPTTRVAAAGSSFALQLRHDSEHADADAQAGGRLHRADPALYPAISRTATEATVPLADEFALGLDLLVRGMRSALAEEEGGRRLSDHGQSDASPGTPGPTP